MLVVELGLLDSGEIQWGTTSSRQYTTPLFKYCARARCCSSRGPDRAQLHDGGVLHEDSFHVFPRPEDYRCTPQSVAPRTLYENADPFELKESSSTLQTNNARYEAISDRAVRVSGSEFVRDPEYTIKLEGVRHIAISDIRRSSWAGCAILIS